MVQLWRDLGALEFLVNIGNKVFDLVGVYATNCGISKMAAIDLSEVRMGQKIESYARRDFSENQQSLYGLCHLS